MVHCSYNVGHMKKEHLTGNRSDAVSVQGLWHDLRKPIFPSLSFSTCKD